MQGPRSRPEDMPTLRLAMIWDCPRCINKIIKDPKDKEKLTHSAFSEMDKSKVIKHCVSLFFITVFICLFSLVIHTLSSESSVKSGILHLQVSTFKK